MNQIKQFKGQLIFTLLLFFIILAMPFQDYLERNFLQGAMNYPESAIGVITHEDAFLTVPENAGPIILNTEDCYLPDGSYSVVFNVVSSEAGSTVEVYDPLYVNPDNTSGRVLASAEIPVTEENIHLDFTVEEYAECIQFRVNSNTALEFQSIYLLSETGLFCDPYIYAGLLLLFSALLFVCRCKKKVRGEVLILLAFAALWSSMPLCFPWLMDGHDMYFHYSRLFSLSDDLANGMFPVRIHTQMWHGFTYLSPVFYPEFFLYPFAVLGRIGMSPIGCYKLLLISINFATAGISYYSFSRLCRSRRTGLIAAFLYTLSMYRLINLYTRAAVGEALAMVFLPLLMLGMYQLFLGDSRRWLTAVLAFTALFQSHMISTELAIGFSLLFGLLCIRRLKDGKRLLRLVLAAASTILLNLWFILPFLDHLKYPIWVLGDKRDLAYSSLYAIQLFDVTASNPASDLLGPGPIAGEMPYSVGIVLLLGVLLFLFTYLQKSRKGFFFKLGSFCLVLGALSLYASSSFFPWKAIQRIPLLNLLGNMQFTFRFLPFATLFLCLVSAIGIQSFFKSRESGKLLFILSAVLAVYSTGTYFGNYVNEAKTLSQNHQMDYAYKTDNIYLIGDEEASEEEVMAREVCFLPSEGITLKDCSREGTSAAFSYERSGSSGDAYVDAPLNYYPYYCAYDSYGNRLETSSGEMARLRICMPEASEGAVTIRFELPLLCKIGDIVSLLTALLLIAGVILSRKRKRTAKERISMQEESSIEQRISAQEGM